jgi:predicted ATPase
MGMAVVGGLDSTEAVCRFLATRRALVVLDNCEHVVDDAAKFVDRVLGAAPRVRLLATSREALDVAGETAWRVPSLSLEGDVADAVALFAERAGHAQPGFELTDPIVREAALAVCQRLDGIPLAIELAAARANVLSIDQIAAHLDERFRLLTRGGRTAGARQQTLQGAIDWSYELLSGRERLLFDALGVLAGEFDLAAVAAVGDVDEFDAMDLVGQLVAKSMVEADPARNRYRLLETLRQYAWDRLIASGRLLETRDAHAAHFFALVNEQSGRMGERGEPVDALDRLEADYDNVRAALSWLIEQRRAEDAARMARRLSGLFNIRHPREGFGWFKQVVAIADGMAVKPRALLLAYTGWAAMNAGDREATVRYAQAAIDLAGDSAPATAYFLLAQNPGAPGRDYAQTATHYRRAMAAAAAGGDLVTETTAMSGLALTCAILGDWAEARRLIPEAIERAERLGNPTISAVPYINAVLALARMGEMDEAAAMFDRGLAHADQGGPVVAMSIRVHYALIIDSPHEGAEVLCPAIAIARTELSGYHQSFPLLGAAAVVARAGSDRVAATLLGAWAAHGGFLGALDAQGDAHGRFVAGLTQRLGTGEFEEEQRHGAELTMPHALQLAEAALEPLV